MMQYLFDITGKGHLDVSCGHSHQDFVNAINKNIFPSIHIFCSLYNQNPQLWKMINLLKKCLFQPKKQLQLLWLLCTISTISPPTLPPFDFTPEKKYDGPSADEISEERRKHLFPSYSHFYKKPLTILDGNMQYVYDDSCKRYLDAFAGIVTVPCGHCHPEIQMAVNKQQSRLQHLTTKYSHPGLPEYAKALASKMPGDLKMFTIVVTYGNTYVLKPSEKDPGASMMLAELALEAGLPKGVFNIVHGTREIVNNICDNMEIKAISFVGSNAVPGYENGNFVGPTILSNVTTDMECYKEEIFGPVLLCMQAGSLEEAIDIINKNEYGNGACIFITSDIVAGKFQHEIEAGMVSQLSSFHIFQNQVMPKKNSQGSICDIWSYRVGLMFQFPFHCRFSYLLVPKHHSQGTSTLMEKRVFSFTPKSKLCVDNIRVQLVGEYHWQCPLLRKFKSLRGLRFTRAF